MACHHKTTLHWADVVEGDSVSDKPFQPSRTSLLPFDRLHHLSYTLGVGAHGGRSALFLTVLPFLELDVLHHLCVKLSPVSSSSDRAVIGHLMLGIKLLLLKKSSKTLQNLTLSFRGSKANVSPDDQDIWNRTENVVLDLRMKHLTSPIPKGDRYTSDQVNNLLTKLRAQKVTQVWYTDNNNHHYMIQAVDGGKTIGEPFLVKSDDTHVPCLACPVSPPPVPSQNGTDAREEVDRSTRDLRHEQARKIRAERRRQQNMDQSEKSPPPVPSRNGTDAKEEEDRSTRDLRHEQARKIRAERRQRQKIDQPENQ